MKGQVLGWASARMQTKGFKSRGQRTCTAAAGAFELPAADDGARSCTGTRPRSANVSARRHVNGIGRDKFWDGRARARKPVASNPVGNGPAQRRREPSSCRPPMTGHGPVRHETSSSEVESSGYRTRIWMRQGPGIASVRVRYRQSQSCGQRT